MVVISFIVTRAFCRWQGALEPLRGQPESHTNILYPSAQRTEDVHRRQPQEYVLRTQNSEFFLLGF